MNTTPKTVVIYHRADFDGLFCGEIAKKFLSHEGIEYIGWDHGDNSIPFQEGVRYFILDLPVDHVFGWEFIPYFNWTENDIRRTNQIIWIDHHASAIATHPESIPGYRIDGVAACRLAWQWFTQEGWHPHRNAPLPDKEHFIDRLVSEPLAVRLAGEYDIWDKRDPRAELFQHGLRGAERDFKWLLDTTAEANSDKYVAEILEQGQAIQYSSTKQNESIIKAYGFTIIFEGLTFLACNHARFNSHLFTAGIEPEHDALLGFNFDGQKQDWRISLYGIAGKNHDLSQIAVKYGGGGHRGACGFRVKNLSQIGWVTA